MILFWVICAIMILIALAFVLPPALQRSTETNVKSDDERRQANILVYRDQLSELEADLRNGIVSEEQYAQDRDEIERRLLEDTAGVSSKKTAAAPANGRTTAYVLGLGIPFLIAALFSGAFMRFLGKFRVHLGRVEKAIGALLVVAGVFFLTGGVQAVSYWLLENFPVLGRLG